MPIKVKDSLPAIKHLKEENIFVMDESRALHQDIRPLKIAILNLMPEKEKTELQLLRRLSNTPLQIEIDFLKTESYQPKNASRDHLETFYTTFSKIKPKKYDGLIITGAPVEKMDFEAVDYWDELKEIMEWSKHNVSSTLHLCWAAQAGLYHHYNVSKQDLAGKQFGVYPHKINKHTCELVRGFDTLFWAPHSRHTTILESDVEKIKELDIVSSSAKAGVYLITSKDKKQVFVTGHSEYDPLTLHQEYIRDKSKGLQITIPENYYENDDETKGPIVRWKSHSSLLFSNWVNYYVYQETPYNLDEVS